MIRLVVKAIAVLIFTSMPVAAAEPAEIEAFTEPYADIELAASEMGILTRIDVKEGDVVKIGQEIASLDDSVLQATLKVAIASKDAQGSLESAQADLDNRIADLEKLQALRERNHASQNEVDRAATDVRVAKARLLAVREELEVKRLDCERIRAQLNRRQIRSTIDGVVTETYREEGEFVSPSQPTVARVVQLDPLKIIFSVPAERRAEVVHGQTVNVSIGATQEAQRETAQAVVEFVSPTADGGSGTFRVKVRLPNPNGHWQSGAHSVLHLGNPPTQRPNRLAGRFR
jgi:RND family efflux transporter MFP subunit